MVFFTADPLNLAHWIPGELVTSEGKIASRSGVMRGSWIANRKSGALA